MYCVEVYRDYGWHIVGQYATRTEADRIARDYRTRGETARVVDE